MYARLFNQRRMIRETHVELFIYMCMHMHLLSTTLFYNCPASGAHVCVGQQLYFLLFHKARAKVCRSPLVTHARFMHTWDRERERCVFVVRTRFAAEICRNCVKIRPRRQKWAAPIDWLFVTVARRGNRRHKAHGSLSKSQKTTRKHSN